MTKNNDPRPSVQDGPCEEFERVGCYSRAQALADGVLIDVTAAAHEAGFRLPAAVTARLWATYVVPAAVLRAEGQNEAGRLQDVFARLQEGIGRRRVAGQPSDRVTFRVDFRMPPDRTVTARLVAVCGPGDDGTPVITLMLEGED